MAKVLLKAMEEDMETLRKYVDYPWGVSNKVGVVVANRIALHAESIQHTILPGGIKPNAHITVEEVDDSPERVSLFGRDIGILRINDVEEQ